MKAKLDLSKFKMIHRDEKIAKFKHPSGHEIAIAISGLHPENRKNLDQIELHKPKKMMAEGGEIDPSKLPQVSPEGEIAPQANSPAIEQQPFNMGAMSPSINPVAGLPDEAPAAAPQQIPSQAFPPPAAEQPQMPAPAEPQAAAAAMKPMQEAAIAPSPQTQAIANSTTQGAIKQATLQNPNDPYGNEAYNTAYMQGLAEQKQAGQMEAAGLSQQGVEQAKAADASIAALQSSKESYDTHFKELDGERKAFQQDIVNQRIDPNRYLGSMSTGDKIQTAIGLALGGVGSGVLGQANPVMDFINKQIDRDIDAQKSELGKKESLLNFNMKQFGNLHDATLMTKVMQMDIAAEQFRAAGAKAMSPLAKAAALKNAGALDMQAAPIVSQIAMRRTLLGGGAGMPSAQGIPPENRIRALIPDKGEQDKYFKDLKDAENTAQTRDNLLDTFDKVAKLQTAGNRIGSPIQSKRQIEALIGHTIASLSKESAGKFTEQDAKMIAPLMTNLTDSPETIQKNRTELVKMASEKMHFPMLKSIGIDSEKLGKTDSTGMSSRDQQMLDWANKNPNDPRAGFIRKKLGQ